MVMFAMNTTPYQSKYINKTAAQKDAERAQNAMKLGMTPEQMKAAGVSTASLPLSQQYQLQQDAANTANEKRYQEIIGGFDALIKRSQGAGAQEAADIRQQFAGLASQAGQDMTSRGLGNTTIAPQVQAGIGREQAGAIGRLNDRMLDRELGINERKLGAIERRDDIGPDFNMLAQLYQGLGASGVQPRTATAPSTQMTQSDLLRQLMETQGGGGSQQQMFVGSQPSQPGGTLAPGGYVQTRTGLQPWKSAWS